MHRITTIINLTLILCGIYIVFTLHPEGKSFTEGANSIGVKGYSLGFMGLSQGNEQTKKVEFPRDSSDSFNVICARPSGLPEVFRKGYVMMFRRELPGMLYLFGFRGNIVWSHQLNDAGFRAVKFTQNRTFLCLLGTKEYNTGYGNAILELSLQGDTLLYLQKGQNDFVQTIHHEIFLDPKNEIVTLCQEQRIYDLRAIGGSASDTINGDGILVLNRQGKRVWKWTVFDIDDPSCDETILQNKKDWMHANSVSLDNDGNYLVSFYNKGQIWKVNARTGKLIWRLGRNGDFKLPAQGIFDEAHAVHVNNRGWLMLFDNGTKNKVSRSLGFKVNERAKRVELIFCNRLLPKYYSDRMGSVYLVGDSSLLECASKQKTALLTNFRGDILWQLNAGRMVPYRAEFISRERLGSFSKTKLPGGY